jgi:hypothetical protein
MTSQGPIGCNQFQVVVTNDNLTNAAIFNWAIGVDPNFPLQNGYIEMSGADYTYWNNTYDINQAAMDWVAEQIGVIIVSVP